MQLAGGNGGWFSVKVCSLSLCLKRPTTRQQENARAPLATQRKNSLGAQHAPRGGGVGLVHLEVNSNPQHTRALSIPMRLPKLPSHNNNRVEKSFQAFKLSDNKPRMGRRHRAPGSAAKKSFWVFITLRQWSPQVKAATTCYYCNQPTHDNVHPREQENHRALPRHNNASQIYIYIYWQTWSLYYNMYPPSWSVSYSSNYSDPKYPTVNDGSWKKKSKPSSLLETGLCSLSFFDIEPKIAC